MPVMIRSVVKAAEELSLALGYRKERTAANPPCWLAEFSSVGSGVDKVKKSNAVEVRHEGEEDHFGSVLLMGH